MTCFFRVDDRVLDHDTYSAHDAIGKVYIDLNPMLTKERHVIISGWFPIFDTMHGEPSRDENLHSPAGDQMASQRSLMAVSLKSLLLVHLFVKIKP